MMKQNSEAYPFKDKKIAEREVAEMTGRLDSVVEEIGELLWKKECRSWDFSPECQAKLSQLQAECDRLEGAINLEYSLFDIKEDEKQ